MLASGLLGECDAERPNFLLSKPTVVMTYIYMYMYIYIYIHCKVEDLGLGCLFTWSRRWVGKRGKQGKQAKGAYVRVSNV